MSSREAFEAWFIPRHPHIRNDGYMADKMFSAFSARDPEIAAKDARIAELEAALYCENSPYEAKTHRCVHCDEEVLR